ncbi:MAG: ABC transporter ATP-binding protein [Lachnospiraceae bacterium]|nr:ABC transporter ATP-binding protein [Lachnospiraceae bacterium]
MEDRKEQKTNTDAVKDAVCEAAGENGRDIAIEVKNVVKVYKLYDKLRDRMKEAFGIGKVSHKLHYALNGVNMNIYRGETVGIIGTNGSGKSTILKIITGVLNPSAGEVNVNGRISALLELGAGFNPEYSGLENVYLNGTMMGFSDKEIDEKLPAILEFADIGDYVHQPVKTYSSGMFVRLAFAVAINIEPEILIVDEALSVGDVFFQSKCYHKFEEFKAMGKTIVFVSHDLNSIAKYCDRVFLLNKGVLLGEGGPKEMIDAYKQVLVGQYKAAGQDGDAKSGSSELNEAFARAEGINPNALEYGDGRARIIEYYLSDEKGRRTNALIKGTEFTLHMKVKFLADLPAPIFAFSIKNVQGTEITGTNSMLEKAFLDGVKAGMTKEITYTQKIDVQGGEYLLSLGVTGYEKDTFHVYHRLYDVLNMTVVSDKNSVGFYDMNSKVTVKDA